MNKNTYKNGNIDFRTLKISWNLYRTEKNDHGENEVFNIEVEDDNNNKIRFDFNNSVMEKGVSDLIEQQNNYGSNSVKEIRTLISKKYLWGGYDDVKTLSELNNKRTYYLVYSILNCMVLDATIECRSFKDFCDYFGYNEDSIKDQKLYYRVVEQYDKLNALNINWYDWEDVQQEEDSFSDEVKALFEVA